MNIKKNSFQLSRHLQTVLLFSICIVFLSLPGYGDSFIATYRGLDQDMVGTGGDGNPNGQPDGHFSLSLNTGGQNKVVTHIVLESADADGNPSGGQVWDTQPNGNWIMGVYRDGRRLNQTDMDIRDEISEIVNYEIYGNTSGWFKQDQNFRITITFADGGKAVTFCKIGSQSGSFILNATYRGLDQDMVGTGGDGNPNGQPDGHFSLSLNTGGQNKVVTHIVLESADADGNPSGGQVWDTQPNGNWIMGVYRDGRRLNPTDMDIRDEVSGIVNYEIYGNTSGWFKPGQNFRITISYADGTQVRAFAGI